MNVDLNDLKALLAVAKAQGFRGAAKQQGVSASAISEAVRRLEGQLGVRLLNRTTRSVAPTEAGQRLLERLAPALQEVGDALDAVNSLRDRPAGTLRLNVPVAACKLVLPALLPGFKTAYPDITVEVVAEDSFVDVLAAGCDAGIRYSESLEQDMIAVPIGPKVQQFACAAAPGYISRRGMPAHPHALLEHGCLRLRFPSGNLPPWEFHQGSETLTVNPVPALLVQGGAAADLAVDAAIRGMGIVYLFRDWLQPHLDQGALVPVLQTWWPQFSGPFLYYPGRRLVPAPLRAFVDYVKVA